VRFTHIDNDAVLPWPVPTDDGVRTNSVKAAELNLRLCPTIYPFDVWPLPALGLFQNAPMLKKASARSERSDIPLVATAAPAAVAAEPAKNLRLDTFISLIPPSRDGTGFSHHLYAPRSKKEPGTY
jgi:hypothetical protein